MSTEPLCPRGCEIHCRQPLSIPCPHPRYQDPVAGSPAGMLQRFLLNKHRAGPIDRSEPAHVTALTWQRIRAAYQHLVDRANAWDQPVSQCIETLGHRTEDTADLYGPPIVHPPGVIPPEVEQAVTEQIVVREASMHLVQSARWAEDCAQSGVTAAALSPEPGWLSRLLHGWGLLLTSVTAPLAGIRTASSPPRTAHPRVRSTGDSARSGAPGACSGTVGARSTPDQDPVRGHGGSETDAPRSRTGQDPAETPATRRRNHRDQPPADRNPKEKP